MAQHAARQAASILDVLALDPVAEGVFRGRVHDIPRGRSFGGQVAGQAVLAAGLTVPADRRIHSAHTYFILPGDTGIATEFEVRPVRDGGAFTTRAVDARQRGRTIFTMTASFHRDEPGLEHQVAVLDAPGPDGLPGFEASFADVPEALGWVRTLTTSLQVEARFPQPPVQALAARGERSEPHQAMWMRSRQPIAGGGLEHAAALMYLTDVLLLSTALGPHDRSSQARVTQAATVNHTVWFHAPLRVDDWFLYDQRSRWAGSGRGLVRGEILDRSGRLCATTAQEGLLRLARP